MDRLGRKSKPAIAPPLKMRIIYFSRSYSEHDHRFLAALARTKHEVFYLKLEPTPLPLAVRPIPAKVRQVDWAGGREPFRWAAAPRLALGLRRVFREVRPDLVHAGPIQTCAFLTVVSAFRPVLTMSWGFDLMQDSDRNAWWRWVTRFTLRRSTYFISDAEVTRARAIDLGMNPAHTAVFPWGVDLKLFSPARPGKKRASDKGIPRILAGTVGAHLRKGHGDFVLFCNRSWEPRYGVDVLARAFVRAASENAAIRLILLNQGSQAGSIYEILRRGRVLDRVRIGGVIPLSSLPRWYRTADLFVSPSHVDGSSVSLMEALACGIPVLVSDIPANREWVQENSNGWLFPDGNATALAEKILAVFERRNVLGPVKRAARKTAKARADWHKNFQVLLEAYERTVQLAPGKRQ